MIQGVQLSGFERKNMIALATLKNCLMQVENQIRRRTKFTDEQISKMIEESTFVITPEVKGILAPSIMIRVEDRKSFCLMFRFHGHTANLGDVEQYMGGFKWMRF